VDTYIFNMAPEKHQHVGVIQLIPKSAEVQKQPRYLLFRNWNIILNHKDQWSMGFVWKKIHFWT